MLGDGSPLWIKWKNSNLLQVKEVDIQFASQESWKKIPPKNFFLNAAGLLSPEGTLSPSLQLYRLDLDEIQNRLEKLSLVKQAQVQRHFPKRLSFHLTLHQPKAILSLGKLYYLSEEGKVFRELSAYDSKDYPIFTGLTSQWFEENPEDAQRALEEGIAVLNHWQALENPFISYKEISEIYFTPVVAWKKGEATEGSNFPWQWQMTVRLTNESAEIRLGTFDLNSLKVHLSQLQKVLHQQNLKISQIELLDVRFHKQIIVVTKMKNNSHGKKINKKSGNFSVKNIAEVL
jgi:hypothetical protein